MSTNDAFLAGVKPGGLTGSTEIRLLLCLLIKSAGPITRQEIENALLEEALVNYFEIGSCLDDITRQKLVRCENNTYTITEDGAKVTVELAYELPRSVRERALSAALRAQTWARKEAEYSASITEQPDGHCAIQCSINGLDEKVFGMTLTTPDRETAELIKKRFILRGNEVYQLLINKLTEDEKG
jgi:DNA-binding PadR family transcriptional regulator